MKSSTSARQEGAAKPSRRAQINGAGEGSGGGTDLKLSLGVGGSMKELATFKDARRCLWWTREPRRRSSSSSSLDLCGLDPCVGGGNVPQARLVGGGLRAVLLWLHPRSSELIFSLKHSAPPHHRPPLPPPPPAE